MLERRVQEIPREEAEADDAFKVISVFHFSKEVSRTHGVPFNFVVKPVSLVVQIDGLKCVWHADL